MTLLSVTLVALVASLALLTKPSLTHDLKEGVGRLPGKFQPCYSN